MLKPLALSIAALLLSPAAVAATVAETAEAYVRLVLAVGVHDSGYVDAYYGPEAWRDEANKAALAAPDIASAARQLQTELPAGSDGNDTMEQLRLQYLGTQLGSLAAYADSLTDDGKRDFDREARALYDTAPPRVALSDYDEVLAQLEQLLPGAEPLHLRVETFQQAYEIPADKLSAVFDAAIAACRERTLKYIDLPAAENFTLEYVKDKPWSGYNWYQGQAHSLIQVNTDLPIRIDRAIDLGCHEGYPGHHTYNALLEAEFVQRRGWVEFSVYPLFSPQSVIAEGSANFGIELAFPGKQKQRFEKRVLYPLAGLDPNTADQYQRVLNLQSKLSFARNEIARLYINGDIEREEAISLSQKYGPSNREQAQQSVRFIDTYGAYVINYNWGRELVRRYVDSGTFTNRGRWNKFSELLASPRLPSTLE